MKVSNGRVFGAHQDRFYISQNGRNKVVNTAIIPTALSDHKLITIECILTEITHKSYYWQFNVKLREDKQFCENFIHFWETWKSDKCSFENIIEWWKVGKVHIRMYLSHSSLVLKKTLEWLEKEIIDIERSMNDNDAQNLQELWTEKENQLSYFFK